MKITLKIAFEFSGLWLFGFWFSSFLLESYDFGRRPFREYDLEPEKQENQKHNKLLMRKYAAISALVIAVIWYLIVYDPMLLHMIVTDGEN